MKKRFFLAMLLIATTSAHATGDKCAPIVEKHGLAASSPKAMAVNMMLSSICADGLASATDPVKYAGYLIALNKMRDESTTETDKQTFTMAVSVFMDAYKANGGKAS